MTGQVLRKGSCAFFVFAVTALCGVLALGGCDASFDGFYGGANMGGAEFGATPGGVQDMGLARELIEAGRVPPAEAFNVEGMFSEHDLPLSGEPCSDTLCVRGAMGLAPDEADESSAWLQVGFSSTVNPETYQRPSLTVVATVDVSGSMSGTPLRVSKEMIRALIDRLEPSDAFGLVTYGSSSRMVVPISPVTDKDALARVVESLQSEGSTNMEAGLRVAFNALRVSSAETDLQRVWLFTDVQPNVGASTASEFNRIVDGAAGDGIGTTVFGVGVGLGQEVMVGMSHLRGGNAFSLFESQDVDDLMEESWPWLACPIAHDLSLEIDKGAGLELADAYGIPAGDDNQEIGLEVASIFLSRKKGAILLRFVGADDAPIEGRHEVTLSLSYLTTEGEPISETIHAAVDAGQLDDRGMAFVQTSVAKTTALAVLVRAMRGAATEYGSNPGAAIATLTAGIDRFEADAEVLADPALDVEAVLARDLLGLMTSGAEQGDLYSPYGY